MSIKECGLCKFWEEIDETDGLDGDCHRYPPRQLGFGVPYNEISNGDHFGFPVTCNNDWCGEFARRSSDLKLI